MKSLLNFVVMAVAIGAMPQLAAAQATRTWVSGVGDDANPCSRTAPCKTFAGAISKTAAGGQINVLDPGGYGSVTITKAIAIIAPEGTAGITNSGTSGIIVNAGVNDAVYIRGIEIMGSKTGTYGVRFIAGGSLTLDSVIVRAQGGPGVFFAPSSGVAKLAIDNSTISDNVGIGVHVAPTGSATAVASISNSFMNNNQAGVRSDASASSGNAVVSVGRSEMSNNVVAGAAAFDTAGGGSSILAVNQSIMSNNNYGAASNGSPQALITVAGSTVVGNTTGFHEVSGGQIFSNSNSLLNNNGSDGTWTVLSPK
ncbi:hypothetical protein SGCZBJ_24955 [Caulobacter zeae]|uniref:Right handed beta helix domain-containing protein n=2 Tax=Caulobacter zeae TaxID=2055137 RepID=A0A2N5CYJ0_9CAUL|nr:hypothetical protein SGCZBJ_24955 [Caulobacter zeae]